MCFCKTAADIRYSQVLILVKHNLAKCSTEGVIMLSNQSFAEGCVFSFSHIFIQAHTHTHTHTHIPVLSEPAAPAGFAAEALGFEEEHPGMVGSV